MSGPIFDNFTALQRSATTVGPDPSWGPPSSRRLVASDKALNIVNGLIATTDPGLGLLQYSYSDTIDVSAAQNFSTVGTISLNNVSVNTRTRILLSILKLGTNTIEREKIIEPGDNQTVTFTFNLSDLSVIHPRFDLISRLSIFIRTLRSEGDPTTNLRIGSLSSSLRGPQGPGPQFSLQPSTIETGEVGEDFQQEFTLVNSDSQTVPGEITLFSGELPPGLQLIDGVLTGQPTQSGRFFFTLQAIDQNGFILFQDYTLLVLVDDDDQVEFDPQELPSGTETIPYTATVNVTGSDQPLIFRDEILPSSFVLVTNENGDGFTITGVPELGSAGQRTFRVIAENLDGEILGLQEYTLIIAVVCIGRGSQVCMSDGSLKCIEEIQRGDEVIGHNNKIYRVARLLVQKVSAEQPLSLVKFEKGCLGNDKPLRDLIMTGNHPLIETDCRRPAYCYKNLKGVIHMENITAKDVLSACEDGSYELYDLQFETEGNYLVNSVCVQSRSPYSQITPLPKELYFNQNLYTGERVWDTYDAELPLMTESVKKITL